MSAPFAFALLNLLGAAAWLDLRRRRIPNQLVGAVVVLWLAALATGDVSASWPNAGVAAAVLTAGLGVWRCGWLGGGDVKLIAALSLWAGVEHIAPFLLTTALCGGLLALLTLAIDRIANSPALILLQVQAGRLLPAALPLAPPRAASLPYGVAVALGGCWLVRLLLA